MEKKEKQKIGDWCVDFSKKLGSGACGDVFEGYSLKDKSQQVAVKVQNLDQLKTMLGDRWKDLIKRETKIIKSIDHPNVVKSFDVKMTQDPSDVYIFMEKCNKEHLGSLIKSGPLSEEEAKKIILQILEGYKAIKKENAVHRDLKPENILFNEGVAKIADFGLSRIYEASQNSETQQYTVAGTPQYRAPELLTNAKYTEVKYPEKLDIWSLGIIWFELLYAELPWKMKDLSSYSDDVENKPLSFLPSPNVSEEAKDVIKGMLQYDDNKRFDFNQVISHKYLN